jgi:glycosyltransferase involved in cell wall biosynthesis
MKEKKLLIFMPSVEDGGVEKNFYLVSNYLSTKLKNVSIITTNKSIRNNLSKKINLIGPSSTIWNTDSRYPKYLICLIYLFFFLLQNKNTLILSFQANAYASLLAKILGIKIITRSNASSEGWSKSILKKILYKIFLKIPNQIIVNSYQFKKELNIRFGVKASVIYNPLNKNSIIKKSKEKVSLKFFKGKFTKIITIGRLVNQKDHLTMLKAINLIKDDNIKLLIIGDGQNKSKLVRYINKNELSSKVKILPFKKNPYKYLILSDIFLFTSVFEGLPNVLLEAQCLKKFIISTNCPTGPKEILLNGSAGDIVPMLDHKKISEKIRSYNIKKKSYKRKILLGYKSLERFDYNNNMQKYLKIINKFIY